MWPDIRNVYACILLFAMLFVVFSSSSCSPFSYNKTIILWSTIFVWQNLLIIIFFEFISFRNVKKRTCQQKQNCAQFIIHTEHMQIDDDLRGKRKPKQKNQQREQNELTKNKTEKEMVKMPKFHTFLALNKIEHWQFTETDRNNKRRLLMLMYKCQCVTAL